MSSARGFTLLELLVALAIGGAVVLVVHAALAVTTDVAARGRDIADRRLRIEAAQHVLRRWLEAAQVGTGEAGASFRGRDEASGGVPLDELTFLTLDPVMTTALGGAPARMTLRVGQEGLIAEYRQVDGRTASRDGPDGTIVLFPAVRGLEIRYLVALGDQYRWFSGWSSRARLPAAVELRFHPLPGDSLPRALRAPLLIRLPAHG